MVRGSAWRRHVRVFRQAWAQRFDGGPPAASPDALDFLPGSLSIQETPPHPLPLWTARTIMALFAVALAWACLGQVDIVAVASGRVIVSERSKHVQPMEDGLVQRVWVRDGDRVRSGQLLVTLDGTTARADHARVQEAWRAASSEAWRTGALVRAVEAGALPVSDAEPAFRAPADTGLAWLAADARQAWAQLRAEWEDIQSRHARALAEVAQRRTEGETARAVLDKLQSSARWAQRREADYLSLVEKGFISGHASQDRTRERIELERDIATQQARLRELEAAREQAARSLAALRADIRRNLLDRESQAQRQREQLVADAIKARQGERLTELRSPVSGTVQQLAVHTAGDVVAGGQVLLVVVPDTERVTAQVAIANQDMGFVRQGQVATVKLEAFPFTRHGTLPATVAVLGADATVDERSGQASFPAYLTLERSTLMVEGRELPITPGMNLVAEIKTGRRRLIDYLLSPVQALADESLRER
ncbi:MAG: HlyD family type I secretion periplasmic adaptor subunit [Hydrogenophaga sp.]|uniref:HlyD family type I secretion periplasmic adaptor subunit n=1 Tax=Hydrogenophaga sp. TaxID=1904254 RepID=UPI0016BBE619|nr:HlyD family type I secretion periplasmic adaptor subunit [Hydrogenophaga sp.]NIM41474.1 HlyD family type I secretion periplasmic adaptor subunit [Hydrogenophaga sp.]NIN26790.1 HlyD family type I secretion periplasmic adaptor subunit [Hydrogenophaga sp.]NIN31489.1 HlyD family type I secretion periplasmic adaptor subunit [Hydrogenophaga sp.]NIN55720.1 HlyD family type I secretion periplasmic adaptor subunit [Hydrogenophaga sp.]NIO51883.1 HlyD family type I secretion periplasmic adaptor subuni